ncbi:MAG TPA: amino acid adenylation domain-containing protein, partial [Thermoanaerobaculia bacterium]|nr:amino acid adenylation domain-containing protein [Thermoanaerobaculia bacterium]
QAARTPGATAVEWEGGALTYGELAAWGRRLAGALGALGVGRETVVGLFAERSPEQVAATLGVLAAGGAWIPLDPSYPKARLEAMIEDSGTPVILAQRRLLEGMPSPGAARVLVLEDALAAPEPGGGLPEVDGRQLAYVFFTSGSTGRPKGVAVPHRAVVNRLLQGKAFLGLGPGDANLQRSPLGFDPSILESFGSLVAGARVVLPRPGGQRDPAYLTRLAAEHRITVLEVTPSILEMLLDQETAEDWTASVRCVLPGAEVLTSALADRVVVRFGAPVVNQYGPTEAAIDLIWHRYRPGADGPTVPIGRPIAGTAAYVLDPFFAPVPSGVPGELWLGGIALARGYLGRPELTADAFRPNPFEDGERLYRTGDLARWLPDGAIDFLGRVDEQVKIRGIRVEPGESEAALRAMPGVREAAVVAVKDAGGARLVAFLAADAAPDARALREALAASLPEAFIPSAFVTVPELPRTPSGKVDRRALAQAAPAPTAAPEETYAAPRTLVEELLAGIWAGLLGVPRVGLHDDFFELGGHSLLATRVVSRISRVLGVELPVGEVFAHPTLEGLAARIAGAASAPIPPVRPVPREPGQPLPASWAQSRLVFLDLLEPGSAAYNLPGWLRLTGGLDVPVLAGTLAEIARRHEVLRSVLRIENGEPVQIAGPPRPVPLPVADLSGLPEARRLPEAERLAGEEAASPFDLGRGPL